MGTCGITVKNLDEKELHCDDRITHALSPRIGEVMAGSAEGFGVKLTGPILLKLFDDLRDCRWHS
jgi:hypothetical protein